MNAIYVRQSIDKKDSLSVDVQEDLCRARLGEEEYRLYSDKGFSGKNTKRPEFQRLMGDVRKGVISRVAVYKIDRISRSTRDFAVMYEEFKERGVEFISARENFDTSMPIGNAMLSITMTFAQLERETTSVRVRDSFYARMEHGAYDATAPIGYRKTRGNFGGAMRSSLEPDDEFCEIIQDMFDTYVYSDKSLGEMARELNARGIPTPRGSIWDSCKLSKIMCNPIYVKADASIYQHYSDMGVRITNPIDDFVGTNGCITFGTWNKNRTKFSQLDRLVLSVGIHEGIIEPDVFLKCQQRLMDNRQINNGRKGTHTWITGLLKCGNCGFSMKVAVGGYKEKKCVCSGKTNYGICSDSEYVDLDMLEQQIERVLLAKVAEKSELRAVINSSKERKENKLKIDLAKIEGKIENLLDALAGGDDISSDIIKKKISDLGREKISLQNAIRECGTPEPTDTLDGVQLGDIPSLWQEWGIDQKRFIARTFIRSISYWPNKLHFVWRHDYLSTSN